MDRVDDVLAERAHEALRRGTRAWHDRVEAAFAPFDVASADGLRHFLLAQARAVLPLERALDAFAIGAILPDWPERRRTGALLDDLATLDLDIPPGVTVAGLATRSRQLGAVYVLEGSRLGGRILARTVAASAAGGLPTSYLEHRAGPGAWASFLARLDEPHWDRADLHAGADVAFGLFHDAASAQAAHLR